LSGVVAILTDGATVIHAISQFVAVDDSRLFGDDLVDVHPSSRISALADRISLGELELGFESAVATRTLQLADSCPAAQGPGTGHEMLEA
jgi:hypothetical protein